MKQYTTTTTNVSDTEIYRGSQQAVYVQAYRMEQLDKEHFDVYVLAEVQYVYYKEQEATQESAETRLKVPVLSRNGEMVVDGLPMFVNDNTLLEDYQLSLTLKEMGVKIGIAKHRIYTSDRRFPKKTIPKLKVMWKMNRLRKMYRDGISIGKISNLYKDVR